MRWVQRRTGLSPRGLRTSAWTRLVLVLLPCAAALQAPEPPSQQCSHDAGPPWFEDHQTFGDKQYYTDAPATPELTAGSCPSPLTAACAVKGAKAAFLDGPVDCGGAGWFCRISPQGDWVNPTYVDQNFAYCNRSNVREASTDDGHCHGAEVDNVYGWWVRDHWHRGYTGTLHCCCNWPPPDGLVTGCDYRREVIFNEGTVDDVETNYTSKYQRDASATPIVSDCRDANEGHGRGYEGMPDGNENHLCDQHSAGTAATPFIDPLYTDTVGKANARGEGVKYSAGVATASNCWTVHYFGAPNEVPSYVSNPSNYPAYVDALGMEGNGSHYVSPVVLATWTVAGDINSFPQDAVKTAIASAVDGVSASDVSLSLVAGSVQVYATITPPSGVTTAAISSGISSNLGSLSQASTAFGVSVEVAATVSVTTAATASSTVSAAVASPPSPSTAAAGVDTGGLVGGIIGGCFVPLLMCILWFSGVFAKYGCPSPCKKNGVAPAKGIKDRDRQQKRQLQSAQT